jgi:thiosulfate dehydrogenase (quinone) large subunit
MTLADRLAARLYKTEQLPDPSFVRTLLSSPKMALIFMAIRIYLGWQWLHVGILKVSNPDWSQTGIALRTSWVNSTLLVPGHKGAAIHYGWYYHFLTFMLSHHWYIWFGKVVAFGEAAIGIALIIGAFVGIAAFFGALANFNYMLAGADTLNPVLFAIALLLVAGWKVAGYLGADYYLLPLIGTPWKPGHVIDVAREPGVEPKRVKGSVLGALGWLAAFGVAALLAVVANNQWGRQQPVTAYLVAMAAVVLAWIIGESILTTTHGSGRASTGVLTRQAFQPPVTGRV